MKETIRAIPLSELHPFPGNPYKVIDDEELQAMADSIRDYGVIMPLVVRPRDEGGYEIISGHRRKKACEKAGIDTVPAFVRDMDRDTAVIALVDSNLHREHILPSEKAFAYKMKLEAIKHQGIACGQLVHKSRDLVSENNESGRQVQRYIRLTELIPPILQMVDDGRIAFSPAVELSYLAEKEQYNLLETIESEDCTPSLSQAQRMKKLSQDGKLNTDAIFAIMTEEKPNQKEQIKLPKDRIKKFFPKDYTAKQMEEVIMKLLADWQRKRERSRNTER
ncbi:MAG TPA: ParB/RepB/Spo0J family partition protein [Clostridiaceae bacterium]|nr:ParB/RepB/Spo0J family partition protein [Clostridiaceae bacterium]